MNLKAIIATGIKTKLSSNSTIANLLASGGDYKIFRTSAPGDVKPPYILMIHMYGGDENLAPSNSFDAVFKVCGVANVQVVADTLDTEIYTTLYNQHIAYPDNWKDWAGITKTGDYADMALV